MLATNNKMAFLVKLYRVSRTTVNKMDRNYNIPDAISKYHEIKLLSKLNFLFCAKLNGRAENRQKQCTDKDKGEPNGKM